jgi:hypothetical protein
MLDSIALQYRKTRRRANVRIIPLTIAAGFILSACSGTSQIKAIPSNSISSSQRIIADSSSQPIIAPTYLYFEYEGQYQQFEVYGRTKSNRGKWQVGTSCKRKVGIKFVSFNAQGSAYIATARRPGASCKCKVTNPQGESGTLEMYVSSD